MDLLNLRNDMKIFSIILKKNLTCLSKKLNEETRKSRIENSIFTSRQISTKRLALMKSIQNVILSIIESVSKRESPCLTYRNLKLWKNCDFTDRVTMKRMDCAVNQEVRFSVARSRHKFAVIIHLLAKIYKLLSTHTSCTRRHLYYQNISLFGSQKIVDSAIQAICCLLNTLPWELGLLSTSKGLIAGQLIIYTASDEALDCSIPGGVLVPQDIVNIVSLESTAKLVLLVEKDTCFQKLLEDGILMRLSPCIVITERLADVLEVIQKVVSFDIEEYSTAQGKGFPDVNTRLLVRHLWEQLRVPVLALVDADPFGIEIMCIYRFGSLALSHQADCLAVPAVRWLGVHPTDISELDMPTINFSREDENKARFLLSRPYISANPNLLMQVVDARSEITFSAQVLYPHSTFSNGEQYKISSSVVVQYVFPQPGTSWVV